MSDTIDAADYGAIVVAAKGKRSKYGAVAHEEDGHRFASGAELRRYRELKLMVTAGAITHLTLQPRLDLIVNGAKVATYVADFLYLDVERGEHVWEDVKGMQTPVYRLKKKLVKALHGIDIVEVAA